MSNELIPWAAHIADTHLRLSQYGRTMRGRDFLDAVLAALDSIHKTGIRTVFHGGDFLDQRTPAAEVVDQLVTIADFLKQRSMVMYGVTGNHERSKPTWIEMLERTAKLFGGTLPIVCIDNKTVSIPRDPLRAIHVYGLPSMSSEDLRTFLVTGKESADVLLWHGAVKEFANFPGMDAVSVADFEACPRFKSVLLGDIHIHQYFALHTTGIIGYPGSTELCSSSEDASKAWGQIWVDAAAEHYRVARIEFPTRPVLRLQIPDDAMLEHVLTNELPQYRGRTPILFIRYNPSLVNVVTRVYSALAGDCILQAAPMSNVLPVAAPADLTEIRDDKRVEQFLGHYIPEASSELYTLARQLLNPEIKPGPLLTEFVNRRLGITQALESITS